MNMILSEIRMSQLSIHAQGFLNAYEILRESNDALISTYADGATETAYGSLPAMGINVVCLAFSVELHLKELHRIVSQAHLNGHNISNLSMVCPTMLKRKLFLTTP